MGAGMRGRSGRSNWNCWSSKFESWAANRGDPDCVEKGGAKLGEATGCCGRVISVTHALLYLNVPRCGCRTFISLKRVRQLPVWDKRNLWNLDPISDLAPSRKIKGKIEHIRIFPMVVDNRITIRWESAMTEWVELPPTNDAALIMMLF